jgi:hypothetical protein
MELNPFGLVAHSREKYKYLAAFDIQRWYGAVSDGGDGSTSVTMRSSFVPLTVDQARALAEEHDRRVRLDDDDDYDKGLQGSNDLIKQLEQQLEHVIATDFDGTHAHTHTRAPQHTRTD